MNQELEKQLEALVSKIASKEDFDQVRNQLLKRGVETLLEAEMTAHLGYQKGDSKPDENQRNGFSQKTIKTHTGEQRINIPRDREANFDPVIVPKHRSMSQELEDCIQLLYAKGMSNADIIDFIESTYGIAYSTSQVVYHYQSIVRRYQVMANQAFGGRVSYCLDRCYSLQNTSRRQGHIQSLYDCLGS